MKVILVGGVAGGAGTAARLRRNDEHAEIIMLEKGPFISYANCGLPYYIGEDYISRENLTPRNAAWFKKRFNIDIFTGHRVKSIDFASKALAVLDLTTGKEFTDSYDRLVIATGATPVIPEIRGMESSNVFVVRNVRSADSIKKFISENIKLKI